MTEKKVVLEYCGSIDPGNIESYLSQGGFKAFDKAKELGPDKVVEEIKASGLKGRGGAGFPCGFKMELVKNETAEEKYIICNADEGEVGTFKDRYILENDPYSIIQGIAISAFAIGAKKAYIYLRGEYKFILKSLEKAVEQVKGKGYLDHVDLEIVLGAGAYICGEESALMNSIEGHRGESRCKPPFPTTSGLFGKPTVINNVETLVNISRVLANGSDWYAGLGMKDSAGTKVFSISGDVETPGVYEFEMGTSLKDILTAAGAKEVKAVQIGGATGRILSAADLDTVISYQTVLGAGGITVFNQTRDIINIVYQTIKFLNEESCGFCVPCREGTEAMMEIYERLNNGDGSSDDIESLKSLSSAMSLSALCGLGQAVPFPVLDSIKLFKNDYDVRLEQSRFLRDLAVLKR